MKPKYLVSVVLFVIALALGLAQAEARAAVDQALRYASTAALGTAFTYQGRLNDGNLPANGLYDFQFGLYDADVAGNRIGNLIASDNVTVTGGIFTLPLDFGSGAFNGGARYLEIAVRPGDSTGAYTTLLPRRAITPAPYALYSDSTGALQGIPVSTTVPTSGDALVYTNGEWGPMSVAASSGIRTKAWDMAQCESSGYCQGNTDAVIYGTGNMWFPAAFQAKIEVDYGQIINVGTISSGGPILVSWWSDPRFTQDCKAAVYSSLDGASWTTITDTLSLSVWHPSNPTAGWGMVYPPGAFRYLRVHIGAGIAGQNCGWVGFEKISFGSEMAGMYGSLTQYDAPDSINYFGSRTAIRTTTVNTYSLAIGGAAIASEGWHTGNADYAEWFEKEAETQPGDLIGLNLDTGKVRRYQPGDQFIGIHSAAPGFVGNQTNLSMGEMLRAHTLVGLLGQLDFDPAQVSVVGRRVTTLDGQEVGVLLNNGKVLLGR